ncbi:bifunctional DNA primase/polymerase [Jidongwangia harbinensis]|uniref:bifunctional DNA primase/polymerase n=1 Tax=Jidongwangia harbinensis TaxID=2878561 RepID=UPI001CD9BFE6|nr:bifunctional DNA primase/polymerase [Jidongwangia harbinensis]MCA2219403.1 bifunctional DNA primase/polymerase [Jidongwangia harbinensis]
MQWHNPTVLDRLRLRRAALRYAAHGWAVLPGARLVGHRFDCDRPGCPIMGCHPAAESWEDHASTDAARVARWWRRRSYSVLLATGLAFDVIEVPAALGLRVLGTARLHAGVLGHEHADARGPVAVTPGGRWMFLVRPGRPLRPELERCLDVVRHGPGSWIPAAPSRLPEGPVRWAVTPEQVRWRLPEADGVQALLVDALDVLGRRPATTVRPVAVPRQMSTARRAA